MKILIAFAGKSGTTEKCARLLAGRLPGAVVADLTRETPRVEAFDTVVVGGAIRAGRLHAKARKFLEQNAGVLQEKRTAFFLCCASAEQAPSYFRSNIPGKQLEHAVCYECFGGEMDSEKQHGLDRLIVKMISKASPGTPAPKILPEAIDRLAAGLKKSEKAPEEHPV